MDLSVAMVEEDYGHMVAAEVAKRLVLFVHRSGQQPQVSQALTLQSSGNDRLRDLRPWILNHLEKDLSVEALAKRAAMSVRNFSRRGRLCNAREGRNSLSALGGEQIDNRADRDRMRFFKCRAITPSFSSHARKRPQPD